MVFFDFILSGRSQFVEKIQLPANSEWHLKIKCGHCQQNFPKEVTFSKQDQIQTDTIHKNANFGIKCKNCERKSFIFIDQKSSYLARPNEHGIIKQCIATMECRGCQITEALIGNMFTVYCQESLTPFQNADFTDLWCEYDEVTQKVSQVEDPRIEIIRSK